MVCLPSAILRQYTADAELELIHRALEYATVVHSGRTRLEGTPYLDHCIGVARLLATWGAPADVLAAALLHDALNAAYSSNPSIDDLRKAFPPPVSDLAEAVSRLSTFGPNLTLLQTGQQPPDPEQIASRLPW